MNDIKEWWESTDIGLNMMKHFLSSTTGIKCIATGWFSYLLGLKKEYGYSSSTNASEMILDYVDNLYDKTIIITGGNSGIGLSTCTAFAIASHLQYDKIRENKLTKVQCHIIMASRNSKKSLQEIENILKQYPFAKIQYIPLDLSKLDSILKFVHTLKYKIDSKVRENIQILINNAAVALVKNPTAAKFDNTEDKEIEINFCVNYLGHFVLTQLFMDHILTNNNINDKDYRVINVSSVGHVFADSYDAKEVMDFDRIENYHRSKKYDYWMAYSVSKLCNVLQGKIMNEQCRKYNVLMNSCHPGSSLHTTLVQEHFNPNNFIISGTHKLIWWLLKTNDQCAATPVLLACEPKIRENKMTALYFEDCGIKQSSKHANNPEVIQQLKDYSFEKYDKIKLRGKL